MFKISIKSYKVNDILKSQWVLWAISVALAFALWFYVRNTEGASDVSATYTVPLEYRRADGQVRFLEQETSVEVEIKGLEWRLARFDPKSVIFYVDTDSVAVGGSSLRTVRNENLPDGLMVASCVPSQVNVRPVRMNSNRIPVDFILPEDIPQGQYVARVEVTPREVLVRGTDRDIVKVTGLQVRPTLSELQSGKEVTLPVQLVPRGIAFEEGGITLEPDTVQLKGTLASGLPKKNVPINVRRVGRPHEDFEIVDPITNPIEVQIEGDENLLAKVWSVDTETVDVSMLSTDFEMVVPLIEPDIEGVSLTDVKSVQLTFRLSEVKAGRQFTNVPVVVRNAAAGANWTVEPATVAVSLEGAPSKIRNATIESAGVSAFVDLSNVFLPSLTLPISVDIASNSFKIVKVEPAIVTVTAEKSRERRAPEPREPVAPEVQARQLLLEPDEALDIESLQDDSDNDNGNDDREDTL